MSRPSTLPKPAEELVLKELRRHGKAMGAYALLKILKPMGISAPPIIYRALQKLIDRGEVHKIRELNAYIACNCDGHGHQHSLSLLTVCSQCATVSEIHNHAIMDQFEALRGQGIVLAEHAVIELPVICEQCR